MSRQIQIRRGTTVENNNFTGAEGEITVDLTKKTLRVHDGSTQGGTELAKSSDIYTQAEIDDLLSGKSSTDLSNITATGKETIAHLAMPSNEYITLTLGTSGSVYTAPADGYICFEKTSTAANQSIRFLAGDAQRSACVSSASGQQLSFFIAVQKNRSFRIDYTAAGTTNVFRFIYANGAQ